MKIIDDYIKQYKKEYEYYDKLSHIVCDIINNKLKENGIRAIVSCRAKNEVRLKEKIINRNKAKNYASIEDIQNDIVDLSGVRIALYFPNDREKIEKIINSNFTCVEIKHFPNEEKNYTYKKRFSGYWATHYRVKLKNDDNNKYSRFSESLTEIQVASVLMHAWAEVEHDLAYKPFNGELSPEENSILDELNGLVMAGEIALERLQKAGEERIRNKNKFDSHYEVANYMYRSLGNKKYLDTGNVEKLYTFMNDLNLNNPRILDGYLENISINEPLINNVVKELSYGDENKYERWIEINNRRKIKEIEKQFLKSIVNYEKLHNYKNYIEFINKEIYNAYQIKEKLLFENNEVTKNEIEKNTKIINDYLINSRIKKK